MKLIPALMVMLGQATDEGECLTSEQIYKELGVGDPGVKFRVSGAMEGLVAIDLIGEAENSGDERVYYLKGEKINWLNRGFVGGTTHVYCGS